MSIKKCCLIAIITATVSVLMACGGGGGGTKNQDSVPTPTGPPSQIDPINIPTPTYAQERSRSSGLSMINADAAYNRGWTGEGVTIGYYEFAIDGTHPELSGKVVDNPYADIEPGSYTNVIYTLEDATQHAQRATGVAAAKRNKIGMHGVAYDSRIEFVSAQNKTFNDLIDQQYIDDPFNVEGREARSVNYLNGRVPDRIQCKPRICRTGQTTRQQKPSWGSTINHGLQPFVKPPPPLPVGQSGYLELATARNCIPLAPAISRSISQNSSPM